MGRFRYFVFLRSSSLKLEPPLPQKVAICNSSVLLPASASHCVVSPSSCVRRARSRGASLFRLAFDRLLHRAASFSLRKPRSPCCKRWKGPGAQQTQLKRREAIFFFYNEPACMCERWLIASSSNSAGTRDMHLAQPTRVLAAQPSITTLHVLRRSCPSRNRNKSSLAIFYKHAYYPLERTQL